MWPVKHFVVEYWCGYLSGARCMVQVMPLPPHHLLLLTDITSPALAYQVVLEKTPLNGCPVFLSYITVPCSGQFFQSHLPAIAWLRHQCKTCFQSEMSPILVKHFTFHQTSHNICIMYDHCVSILRLCHFQYFLAIFLISRRHIKVYMYISCISE